MVEVVLLSISSVVIILLTFRTAHSLTRYTYRPLSSVPEEQPSVSVCIAARNETHALTQSLERVLKSEYEKLEILVLDDGSDDDTSLIIKSFAHAGVRFIAGRDIPPGWLGKNHANQTLAQEASGEYLLFLDVDTVIQPHTVRQLVGQLQGQQKSMLSVLPRREDNYRASAIFGTLRYYWSLVLATKRTPPSASTLWMIRRTALLELERGLPDYGWSVRPEAHIAQQLQQQKEYYYLIGTRALGVGFEKRWHSQAETATRLYYPIFGHTPLRAFISFVGLLSLLLPFLLLILGRTDSVGTTVWTSVLYLGVIVNIAWFTFRTSGSIGWQLRIIALPYILAQEAALLLWSVLRYSTHSVKWKGRPVQAQPSNRSHLTINE